ncbi:MAG: 4Fe-4S dicluster domain-containing protein [Desulfohalobiaceae bacterium]
MQGFRHLDNVATLQYDPQLCVGCGACLTVCPHQVFGLEQKKAACLDQGACMECGACALNCPAGAISMRPGYSLRLARQNPFAAPGGCP